MSITAYLIESPLARNLSDLLGNGMFVGLCAVGLEAKVNKPFFPIGT